MSHVTINQDYICRNWHERVGDATVTAHRSVNKQNFNSPMSWYVFLALFEGQNIVWIFSNLRVSTF